MRIKSDFKDYYDGLLAHDEDRETLYLRRRQEIESKHLTGVYLPTMPIPQYYDDIKYFSYTIGFCGKLYGMVIAQLDIRGKRIEQRLLSIEECKAFLSKYVPNSNTRWNGMINFFESIERHKESHGNLFNKYRAPCFVYEVTDRINTKENLFGMRYHLVINPKLAAYNFQKIFPPYQAYQEVRMWLSNLTSPERPIPPISNEDMIEAKGFDLKSSFRKEKKK